MIVQNVFIHVKPDREEEYLRSMNRLIENSRCNICYDMFRSSYQPQKFVRIEYRQDDAIVTHNESEHFQFFLREVSEFLVEPMDFKKYFV